MGVPTSRVKLSKEQFDVTYKYFYLKSISDLEALLLEHVTYASTN